MSYNLEYDELQDRPLAWLRDNDPDLEDARYLKKRWPDNFDIVGNTAYDEHQDYGGPADKSNYEFWKKSYAKTEGKSWWDLGHDSGILVRIQLLSSDEKESYEYLEDNYSIDDDRMYEIEREVQEEAWDKYDGRKDFKDAILKGAEDEERELVEELLDAMPKKAFDTAVWHAWSDNENYPEMEGGWNVRFPDPDEILFPPHRSWKKVQSASWDRTAAGLIDWMTEAISSGGAPVMAIVRLSDKAFCRVSREEAKTQTWPGATYTKYGEPMALNIKWQDVINAMPEGGGGVDAYEQLKVLFAQYADDANMFIGEGPSVEFPYDKTTCLNPYLSCELKFIADAKARIIGGPAAAWTDETDITGEMVKEQQAFDAMTAKMYNLALEGALRCNLDPSDDLVDETTAELLWLYRDDLSDPFKEKSYYAVKPRQDVIMENACDITQKLFAKLPAVCDLRQLKFPFASESQRQKHQKRKRKRT